VKEQPEPGRVILNRGCLLYPKRTMANLHRVLTAVLLAGTPFSVALHAQRKKATPPPPPAAAPEAAPAPAPAQQPDNAPFTADKIVLNGIAPYTEAEVLPIAGFKAGDKIDAKKLGAACQALVDTGLFADAQVSVASEGNVNTVTFALKTTPTEDLARASFANFVWSTPSEVDANLRANVPLYHGRLPATPTSTLAAAMQAELVKFLASKGVTATVAHSVVEPSPEHPYRAVEFRVTDPEVKFAQANISGSPGQLIEAEVKAQNELLTLPYNEGIAGTTIYDVLLGPARHAGYITAQLVDIQRQRRTLPHEVNVIYTARLVSGPLVRIRNVFWKSTPVYSAADFARDTPLRAGAIPTETSLIAAKKPILAAYHAQGYAQAEVNVKPDIDKTGGVSYAFSVVPGDVYKLHSVAEKNLPADAQAEFDATWTMKPGDPFNDDYVQTFLQNKSLKVLNAYTYSYSAATNPDTHMVDLVLDFKRQ
jgi:outer membrane protein insertion porin family